MSVPASATVRKFDSSEWPIYRDLRLRSLADSPNAFGSTLAAEQNLTSEEWTARLATGASSSLDLPLIALGHGKPAGLAWAKVDGTDTSLINIYQMWVAPEFRGRGLGSLLLGAAIGWARSRNAHAIHLMVTCGDTPAMRLYNREGFTPIGATEALRPG